MDDGWMDRCYKFITKIFSRIEYRCPLHSQSLDTVASHILTCGRFLIDHGIHFTDYPGIFRIKISNHTRAPKINSKIANIFNQHFATYTSHIAVIQFRNKLGGKNDELSWWGHSFLPIYRSLVEFLFSQLRLSVDTWKMTHAEFSWCTRPCYSTRT